MKNWTILKIILGAVLGLGISALSQSSGST